MTFFVVGLLTGVRHVRAVGPSTDIYSRYLWFMISVGPSAPLYPQRFNYSNYLFLTKRYVVNTRLISQHLHHSVSNAQSHTDHTYAANYFWADHLYHHVNQTPECFVKIFFKNLHGL